MILLIASDGVIKIIVDIWLAPLLEDFLDMGNDFTILLWFKLQVFNKPFLSFFEKLTFLDTTSADL